jgi:hypothetical protein
MLELNVLLIVILIIVTIVYLRNNSIQTIEERFENYYLSSCPAGYKSFYNTDGDIICCDGEVVANKCIADKQCTLNGKGTQDMPNCVTAILEEYAEKSKIQCPTSMSSYYEDRANKIKGCTNGLLNVTLNAPQNNNQPKCTIYSTQDENNNSKDSCANQKQLDMAQCFGNNCTKEIVQPVANGPVLIAIGFSDNTGMHRVAYTQASLENYLNITNPGWTSQGRMDLSKNINVAEVAKAYYIDRTIDQSQVQF